MLERRLGPYRLVQRLGRGGMGEVFLAHDPRLDRWVAIKHAHPQHGSPEHRARFQREAWAAARLAHPAIVAVFDVIEEAEGDWIVMEYVDGPTLREVLRQQGVPRLDQTLEWSEQIVSGLAAAHEKGIVHRDLKAENVMVATAGHVKIVDFGLAKSFAAPSGLLESAGGVVHGTLRTMAPEQARGQEVDARADLFSFGILLYELLSGRLPFEGKSPVELLSRLALDPHVPVTEHAPAVPARLSALVDRLLAKAPEERPATARRVAAELREVRAELTREPGPAITSATSTAVPALSTPTLELSIEPPTSRPRPAFVPPPRRWRWLVAAGLALGLVSLAATLVFRVGRSAPPGSDSETPVTPITAGPGGEPRGSYSWYRAGLERLERWDRPGNVEAAVEHFQRGLAAEPHSAPLLAGLARAYWRQSRAANRDRALLTTARTTAEQAITQDDHLASAQISLAFPAIDLGDFATAEAALDRAALLEPDSPALAQGRGNLALARGDLAGAEAAFREALRRADTAEFHNALGAVHYRQKQYPPAEQAFRRAIELAPDAVHGYRNLAAVLQALGQNAAAASALQRAIEIAPNPSLYSNLGTLLFYEGRYVEANGAFTRALEAARREGSSHFGVLWANLADSHRLLPEGAAAARGAYGQAVRWTRVEVASRPEDAEPRSRLALYLARLGRAAEARQELVATLALPRLDVSARLRVVQTHELLGERPAALAALAAAFAAGLPLADVEREPGLAPLRADPAYGAVRAAARG